MPKTLSLAVVAPPVCMRTLTRSRGWPTRTQHAPPTPPERNDLRAEEDWGVDVSCGVGEAGLVGVGESLVVMVGVVSEEDVDVDMMERVESTK